MSFIWNTKNTDRNGANEQNTHITHKERDNLRKGLLMLVTDIPAFFRNNLPYFTTPSLFTGRFWTCPFWGNFNKLKLPFIKGRIPTMTIKYTKYKQKNYVNIMWRNILTIKIWISAHCLLSTHNRKAPGGKLQKLKKCLRKQLKKLISNWGIYSNAYGIFIEAIESCQTRIMIIKKQLMPTSETPLK